MLWTLNDNLQAHMRSLESLGIKGEQYGVILTALVLSQLPVKIRLEWARDGEHHESDLDFLMKFISKEIKRRERSQVYSNNLSSFHIQANRLPSAAALHTSSHNAQSKSSHVAASCGICHKAHPTARCWNLTKIPVSERRAKLRSAGLCYQCLNKGHVSFGCSNLIYLVLITVTITLRPPVVYGLHIQRRA